MGQPRTVSKNIVRAVAAAVTLLAGAGAMAQREDAASARQIYEQERQACMAGQTQQSRADCLYEARSALRDRLAGGITIGDTTTAANSYSGTTSGQMAQSGYADSSSDMRAPRADRH
jgi:hypothetical protein